MKNCYPPEPKQDLIPKAANLMELYDESLTDELLDIIWSEDTCDLEW
jgi:hypothetical protein